MFTCKLYLTAPSVLVSLNIQNKIYLSLPLNNFGYCLKCASFSSFKNLLVHFVFIFILMLILIFILIHSYSCSYSYLQQYKCSCLHSCSSCIHSYFYLVKSPPFAFKHYLFDPKEKSTCFRFPSASLMMSTLCLVIASPNWLTLD